MMMPNMDNDNAAVDDVDVAITELFSEDDTTADISSNSNNSIKEVIVTDKDYDDDTTITTTTTTGTASTLTTTKGGGEESDADAGIAIQPVEATSSNSCNSNISYAADSFIAAEMAKLSTRERENIYYDMHGISGQVEETDEVLQTSFRQLRDTLDEILLKESDDGDLTSTPTSSSSSPTYGYRLALSIDASYVQNPDFEIAFLRCDRFDVKKAANRLIRHFRMKLDLFGRDKLCRTIVQDDLEEDGKGALYDGYKQVLPLRDRAGRLVYCDMSKFSKCDDSRSLESKLRRKFYSQMVAAEDVETQKKGAVLLLYAVDALPHFDFAVMQRMTAVIDAMPVRLEAIHVCHNSRLVWGPVIAMFQLVANVYNVLRSKVHYGDHAKCLFELQTFGIPVSVMPLTSDGNATVDQNAKIWEQRHAYERQHIMPLMGKKNQLLYNVQVSTNQTTTDDIGDEQPQLPEHETSPLEASESSKADGATYDSIQKDQTQEPHPNITTSSSAPSTINTTPASSIVLFPAQFDVLLGRGKGYHCHVGNIRFRNLLQELVDDYQVASRAKKKELTMSIVKQIQAIPGRFLRQDVTGWVVVDDEEARLKVSHTFRNLKASSSGKGNSKDDKSNNSGTKKNKSAAAMTTILVDEKSATHDDEGATSKRSRNEMFGREFYALDDQVAPSAI